MALDWFGKTGSSESVAELIEKKRYAKALEKLRAEFEKGNRSVGLRLQYAEVLAKSEGTDLAIPILLGLSSELVAAGAHKRAREILEEAERLKPGRPDVAARLRSLEGETPRDSEEDPRLDRAESPESSAAGSAAEPDPFPGPEEASLEEDFEAPAGPAQVELSPVPAPEKARAVAPPLAGDNDAVDLFGPALSPPSLAAPDLSPSAAEEVTAELAPAPAAEAADVWVDAEAEAVTEVLVAEVVSEPSIADIAEMAVAEGREAPLAAYLAELAARFPLPEEERPGLVHLAAALFADLDAEELDRQAFGLTRRPFEHGQAMVEEGDPGDSLFILARGRARVLVTGGHGRAFEVAELAEGDTFGEISMVGGRRMATVEALGPCETLEVSGAVIENLAAARPLVQQIVEEALLRRASSSEVEAVKSIPAMDAGTPARALALFDRHFGPVQWSPKLRMRLADLLTRTGHYVDAVPVLVGLADQMQAAGQPARALGILGKIASLGIRAERELHMAPLHREPRQPRPVAPNGVFTYVVQGRPVPTPKASQQFRRWLQDLMGEARVEDDVTSPLSVAGDGDRTHQLDEIDDEAFAAALAEEERALLEAAVSTASGQT